MSDRTTTTNTDEAFKRAWDPVPSDRPPGSTASGACGNCGDGSGWSIWRPLTVDQRGRAFVWVACADCNDDARKPKPDLCEGCGETAPFCRCPRDTRDLVCRRLLLVEDGFEDDQR